jgi:hypothetical protein
VWNKFVVFPSEVMVYLHELPQMNIISIIGRALSLDENAANQVDDFGKLSLCLSIIWIILLFVIDWMTRKQDGIILIKRFPAVIRWFCYWALVSIIILDWDKTFSNFIYFAF